jgi:L-aspartate oxidase
MDLSTVDLPALPDLLAAPAPGWVETTDVIVVGSGRRSHRRAAPARAGLRVTVVTKVNIDDGSTRWAQRASPRCSTRRHAGGTPRTPRSPGQALRPAAVRVLVEGTDPAAGADADRGEFDRNRTAP